MQSVYFLGEAGLVRVNEWEVLTMKIRPPVDKTTTYSLINGRAVDVGRVGQPSLV